MRPCHFPHYRQKLMKHCFRLRSRHRRRRLFHTMRHFRNQSLRYSLEMDLLRAYFLRLPARLIRLDLRFQLCRHRQNRQSHL